MGGRGKGRREGKGREREGRVGEGREGTVGLPNGESGSASVQDIIN